MPSVIKPDAPGKEAEQISNGAAPPPAYQEPANTGHAPDQPPDQPPDLTAAFAKLSVSNAPRNPDPDTCLAHLKLLAAFQNMKEDIGYTDGLWNIWDTRADNAELDSNLNDVPPAKTTENEPDKMAVLSKLREKRWALFVARAVDRYEAWWSSMFRPSLTEQIMATPRHSSYETFPSVGDPLTWTSIMLPPLGKPRFSRLRLPLLTPMSRLYL